MSIKRSCSLVLDLERFSLIYVKKNNTKAQFLNKDFETSL